MQKFKSLISIIVSSQKYFLLISKSTRIEILIKTSLTSKVMENVKMKRGVNLINSFLTKKPL